MSAVSTLLLRLRTARLCVAPDEMRDICERGGRLCREGKGKLDAAETNAAAEFAAGKGIAYFYEGKYREAADAFEQARQMATANGATELSLQLTLRLAQCRIRLGDPEGALNELSEADRALGNDCQPVDRREHHLAVSYSHRSDLARWCGHADAATELADRCIDLSTSPQRTGRSGGIDTVGGAIGCISKARVAISVGDYRKAVDEAYRARNWLRRSASSRWWSYVACFTLTEALARSGDAAGARSVFDAGREAWLASPFGEESMNPRRTAEGNHMSGLIELHMGNLEKAERLLEGVAARWRNELRYVRCAPDLAAVMLILRRARVFNEVSEIMDVAGRHIGPFREINESDLA